MLSEDIGISKVSLYKLLKRDDIKAHVFKQDNVTVVDETGESLIKTYYSWERDAGFNASANESVDDLQVNLQTKNEDIIALLQEQLREKDNQINALLEIVSNSQKLQVTQLLSVDSMAEAAPTAEKEKKPGFWRGLFLKK